MASSTNPATWAPLAAAVEAYKQGGFDGIGFALGDGYAGVDLDGCRTKTGEIAPWARGIIERIASYCEASPSGHGIHIIIRGTLPDGLRKASWSHEEFGFGVEMYDSARYFTITGEALDGFSLAERTEVLAGIHSEIVDAHGFIEWARSKKLDKVPALWRGEWSPQYPSQSEADLALCSYLGQYCRMDAKRIDRLFRLSGLYREKWGEPHASDGRTYGEITIRKAGQSPEHRPGDMPRGVTAAELMRTEFPEPVWIVDRILPNGLALLTGKPKKGKSGLALGITVAVACGGRALGHVPVNRGTVLYLALEDGNRRLKKRLAALLGGGPAPDNLHLHVEWPRAHQGGIEALETWIAEHPNTRLVVIDTLARFRPPRREGGDIYAQDYAAMEPLKKLADAHDLTVVVVHHNRKAESDEWLDEVSGTNGLAGAADTILILRRARGQADATLYVVGRDVEEAELAMRFNPRLVSWELLGDAAKYSHSKERQEVIDLLERSPKPLSPAEAAVHLGKNRSAMKKLMWQAHEDGDIASVGGGRYVPLPQALRSDTAAGIEAHTAESIEALWP